MSNNKIEVLAERRSARKNSDKTLRVLRHLDAARAKLEALQTIRRQMKEDLQQALEDKQAALARADELERNCRQQENEIETMQILLDEQADLLARHGLGNRRMQPSEDDGPALTVLAVEKAGTRTHQPAGDEPAPPVPTVGLLRRQWHRWFSGDSKKP